MIIVTGGTGFIGSNILASLEQRGYKELVVSDEPNAHLENISKRNIHDFVAPPMLLNFCTKNKSNIQAILHMGATSSTMITDASLFVKNNYQYSLKLWDWCVENKVPFIYASSAATYGNGNMGFEDDYDPKSLSKLRPLNHYGRSKHLFDRKIVSQISSGHKYPPQWVGLKFFNVYGPNEYHKGNQRSVAATIFPDAMTNGEVKLFKSHDPNYADGEQLRDFVWVGDCVNIILWLVEKGNVNGIFNVGTGKARSFRELACALFAALDKPEKIKYIDMPVDLRPKYQYFTEANMERLINTGYTKQPTSLEAGIRKYVQQFLIKPDPYL
tara:strand:- start:57705 stop:58685 length:981 start_codon:yes stop_codon:yes gene_type:complete